MNLVNSANTHHLHLIDLNPKTYPIVGPANQSVVGAHKKG